MPVIRKDTADGWNLVLVISLQYEYNLEEL